MYNKGDFHIHSTFSDGRFTPSELLHMAKKSNVDIMALTDHDNTDGIEEALIMGANLGIKVIPGIELSTTYIKENIHVLGYFNDKGYLKDVFQDYLKKVVTYRIYRSEQMVKNLKDIFGIKIDFQKLFDSTSGVVGRPHIAQAIIDEGYKYEWNHIFKAIIGKESPAYVPNMHISLENGIKLLKDANAFVVMAHPVQIKNTSLELLCSLGFDGIEAIYPQNTPLQTNNFINLAMNNNLVITAGSDFHGISVKDEKHGNIGDVYLSEDKLSVFLEKLGI
ncbi:MAG TPA: PHP domain-containing protein [Clostridiaceae bacterium]